MKKTFAVLIIVFLFTACSVGRDAPGAPNPSDTPSLTINELADLILESAEFPAMITSAEQNETQEIITIQQALSVHLIEVVLITPATEEAINFLQERQRELKEQLAFYPAQILSAEASVVGAVHNIAYLICHEDAAEIEKIINNP
ncbi:MAG: hypothetical protein FWD48_06470 [Oscillospiraceae bacterium]|nr:hypothetical protein [Oscillospiraceae bacterium]